MSATLLSPAEADAIAVVAVQSIKARRTRSLERWTSPLALAQELDKQFKDPPHIHLLNDAIVETIQTGGRLIVMMPPRHGKSEMCSHWLPTWILSCWPEKEIILTSYAADFAAEWGRKARDSAERAGVRLRPDVQSASRWMTKAGGGMVTAGVGGGVSGRGADVLFCDDPVKNAEEANSPTYRQRMWDWWRSTAMTRLQPGAAVIIIMTRWHMDDLAGRCLREEPGVWRVLSLPALAEGDDILGRAEGEALWPERYPASELAKVRERGVYWWNALYQQRPYGREGAMFNRGWFGIVPQAPASAMRVRYWDKAATAGGGSYTAGVLVASTGNGLFYLEDMVRGQWSSGEREKQILATARSDAAKYRNTVAIVIEQEPGSGGKDSVEATIRNLVGHPAYADRPSGSKDVRAQPLAAQAEVGNIMLVQGRWNEDWLAEASEFPVGENKDAVDATSGAFNALAPPLPGDGHQRIVYYDPVVISRF